jgi:probable HAF family extracellular repeat protein
MRATACGSGALSITNLSSASGNDTFQVAALNSAGQLTGYFYGIQSAHGFLYQSGQVTDLGTLGGSISEGLALNSSGQVAGMSFIDGDSEFNAFLYSTGSLLNLGTLGGPFSSASLINDAGVIAGSSLLPNAGQTTAFVYSGGSMVSVGTLGGPYSSPFGINNPGQVVGESSMTTGDIHAFIYANGGLMDLGTLGGNYSSAFSINDPGMVVGESASGNGDIHAFVWSAGTMADLGTFGGTYSSAFQVNSNGQVIGIATTTGDAETHGFIYTGGVLVDLGTLGTPSVTALAINNRGQVVGNVMASDGTSLAFLWQTNQITDLNTVLPPNSGWQLSSADFINDAGRIVGTGTLNGSPEWFILDLPNGNNSPVAIAGPDQTVDCQAQATLDGSHSSDPDGDSLAFEWSAGGTVLGTNSVLTVSLPSGTNVVTLKVTDTCGASSQTNLNVIVADTTPPTGSCPAAVTASANVYCQAPVPNFVSQVVATDNCTAAQALVITQSPVAGTLVGLGVHPVTITVTDNSGNSSACSVLFTVADTTPPTIVSTPAAFTLSAGSDCQAQVPSILANVVATDSCTPVDQLVKTQSPAAGTLIGAGSHSILVTVTDGSGNSSSASVPFQVADTTAPTFLSVPGALSVSADNHCQGAVPNVLGAVLATDNCTDPSHLVMTQNPAAGTVLPHGNYSVTVTATDAAGNSSSVAIPLAIVDTTAPSFEALSVSPSVLSPPNHQLVPVTVSALVVDNCDSAPITKIVSVTASEPTSPGDIQITGDLTVSLAATKPSSGSARVYSITVQSTDASGNSSSGVLTFRCPKTGGGNGGSGGNNVAKH